MASKTLIANRSSILADSNSGLLLGGGQDLHLSVIANPGGYDLRGLVGFSFPAGFFSDMRKITKVELRLTGTSSVGHVTKGASRKAVISRLIGSWAQNSAGESWTTTPVVYPGPSSTSSGRVTATTPATSATLLIDITAIGVAWAPASVLGPSGAPGGGAVQYGLSLTETGGAAEASEVWSAVSGVSSGARPALVYTYETNAPPDAPTIIRPVGPDQIASNFAAQGRDPEADALNLYDLQVSTDSTFAAITHWNLVNQTTGLTAAGALSRNYAGTALTNGDRYYWRVRMRDAGSATFGPWSSIATFVKSSGGPSNDAYDYWMAAILADMAEGRTAVRIGTLRPVDEQVAALVCAEYGELFTLAWDETSPPISELVYLLGERVSLSPSGWAVDAIVELKREVG